jgi:hypothetical protein
MGTICDDTSPTNQEEGERLKGKGEREKKLIWGLRERWLKADEQTLMFLPFSFFLSPLPLFDNSIVTQCEAIAPQRG